jgi:glucosamine--fructose-6-phosphate aminotransferase (isomerizing)
MFIVRIFNIIKYVGRFLAICQVFIGKHPANVSAPAIIFFPIMTSQLNCGFAGLMTFQTNKKTTDLTDDLTLTALWGKIKSSGLKNALNGKITPEAYLNGLETLNSMEKTALELKQESKQEILFFEPGRAKKLSGLVEKMKVFWRKKKRCWKITPPNLLPPIWKLLIAGLFCSRISNGF